MEYEIKQVGQRWFIVTATGTELGWADKEPFVNVEATYSLSHKTGNISGKRWKLKGLGATKYRDEIVKELTAWLKPRQGGYYPDEIEE